MGIDFETLAAANTYTKESLIGKGAIQGDPGPGVPSGGTKGQIVSKKSGADYDTEWADAKKITGKYNVLDHGLVGDGSTDNTTALRSLISTIPNGSIIFFPVGTYKITEGIEINKDVTFLGENEEMQSANLASNRTHDPMSIIKYGGSAANVTMFTRASGYFDINFVNLTLDGGNSYDVTDNWNGTVQAPTYTPVTPWTGADPKANYWYEYNSTSQSYSLSADTTVASGKTYYTNLPFYNQVESVARVGINGLDLSTAQAPGIVKNCMFWGFSGYGVKVTPHKYIERCGFFKCKKGIVTTFSDSLLHDLWFCKCGTAIYVTPKVNDHFVSINLSDVWADQLIDHLVESEAITVTSAQLVTSNLWVDSVGKSAFYLPDATLTRARISGTFGRVGMDYAGLPDQERSSEIAPSTDFLVCANLLYCILELNISNITLIKGVNINRPCFSRLFTGLKSGNNSQDNKITCNSLPSTKLFDVNTMPDKTHLINTEYNGTDGDIVFYTNTVKFVNGFYSFNNSPIGRVKAPGKDFLVYNTAAKKLYRSTQANNSQAWAEVVIGDIPSAPNADGTYTLQCVVSSGTATYSWV